MNMRRNDPLSRLQRGLEDLHSEGQGVWQLAILSPDAAPAFLTAALAGDPSAATTLRAAQGFIQQILRHRSASRAPLCLLCDNALWRKAPPAAIGVITAYRDDPHTAIGHGICADCTRMRSSEQLQHDVLAKLRTDMITDLRVIQPPSEPGRA
jgi:hypothetical protein